jgi:hypothetical protein
MTDEVFHDPLVQTTKSESLPHGLSRSAGTMVAVDGNSQHSAICFDINEKSLALPPNPIAPNAEQNSRERQLEMDTCSMKSASPGQTLNDDIHKLVIFYISGVKTYQYYYSSRIYPAQDSTTLSSRRLSLIDFLTSLHVGHFREARTKRIDWISENRCTRRRTFQVTALGAFLSQIKVERRIRFLIYDPTDFMYHHRFDFLLSFVGSPTGVLTSRLDEGDSGYYPMDSEERKRAK